MSNVRIELLCGDNFDSWKIQVEALLIKNDYWEYVSGEKPKPDDDVAKVLWETGDRKARSELILALDPCVVRHVRKMTTAREVWLKLQSLFASRGPAKKATLMKRLMLQKMSEDQKVSEHLNSFFEAVDKLEDMGIVIHDDLLAIMLLYSLPASYENFRCAIESRDELPKPEQLKVKIIEEYNSRGNTKVDNVEGALYLNVNKHEKKGHKTGNSKNIKYKCFKCHSFGHKASECKKKKESIVETRYVESCTDVKCEDFEALTATQVSDDCCATDVKNRHEWIFDSGCTSHMCNDGTRFDEVLPSSQTIKLATNSTTSVQGRGTVKILACNNDGTRKIQFLDTLFVPELRNSLISIAKLTERGCEVIFKRDVAFVIKNGEVKLTADRRGELYYLRELDASASVVSGSDVDLYRWHERMGHLNARDLMQVLKKSGLGSPKTDIKLQDCDVCAKGKMVSLPFVKSREPCKEKLTIIYSDVVGPMRVQSNGGNKYFVTFIDDSTRWCQVFMIKSKNEVLSKFKMFKCHVENLTGRKIKTFQSDNGTEYKNKVFDTFLQENGIQRRLTTPYTPQSNGTAERMNRTLLEMARCMLLSSGLSASFWAEAIATACYLRNRCPTSSLNGGIPYEKWFEKPLNVSYLRTFGTKVHVLYKEPGKDKFASRAIVGYFVGYPSEATGYKIWIPEWKKFIVSRDVRFQEGKFIENECKISKPLLQSQCENEAVRKTVEIEIPLERQTNVPSSEIEENRLNVSLSNEPTTSSEQPYTDCPQRTLNEELHSPNTVSMENTEVGERRVTYKRGPGRPKIEKGQVGRPRKIYNMIEVRENSENESSSEEFLDTNDFAGAIETSLKDALSSDEKSQWEEAILSEIRSLVKNDTWRMVTKPLNRNVVGCRYVLTTKLNVDKTEKKKARLVAKGYSQQPGLDYHRTFAPVARLATVRLLIALAVEMNMDIDQIDIDTAYLNGDLNEDIYMKVPDLLEESLEKLIKLESANSATGKRAARMLEDIKGGGNTCLLNKSLYGLKQAGRQWNIKLDTKLKEMGLRPTVNEPCLYHKRNKDGSDLYVVIYVDDILIASQKRFAIDTFKHELAKRFELKDFGQATFCLGINIKKNGVEYHLSQEKYINDILKKFGMENSKPVKTPMETGKPVMSERKKEEGKIFPYRELIGSLMYLSVATRPDIANATAKLAQFAENPDDTHWKAAKRILRYLKGTISYSLVYKPTGLCIQGYADADWGSCTYDRRSFTGYVFVLGGAGISWASQKQRIVATSTCEAEFVSLAEAMKEAMYLNSLLKELGLHNLCKVRMHADNLSAIYLAEDNGVYHAKSKHIDIRYFFIRDVLRENKSITLEHLGTDRMLADILTKPLSRVRHESLTSELGLCFRL